MVSVSAENVTTGKGLFVPSDSARPGEFRRGSATSLRPGVFMFLRHSGLANVDTGGQFCGNGPIVCLTLLNNFPIDSTKAPRYHPRTLKAATGFWPLAVSRKKPRNRSAQAG